MVLIEGELRPPLTKEERAQKWRDYQRKYYQANSGKAKEYQRRYNLTHKKKRKPAQGSFWAQRPKIKEEFNLSDLQHLPFEKLSKALTDILTGKRQFVQTLPQS